ncbi:MAG: ABC transporter ATP-binding protein [Acidobacteriota bacterium]
MTANPALSAGPSPLLALRSVRKVYGEGAGAVEAVTGVDLDLMAGEFTLLMGPSGSGKTTLLMMMGCLLKPTSGTVSVAGVEVQGLPESALPAIRLRYLGYIFQGFNLFPALTASENVEVALNLKGVRGDAARAAAARHLSRIGLESRLAHRPEDLSGGEKQRVAIARALAAEPPVILADEPTASLDGATGHRVTELLRQLAREEARTVFVVTHDPRILDLADRILHMEDGRIVKDERK